MKTLIATLFVFLSLNAQATDINLDEMSLENKQALLKVLNKMEPQVLETVLSEEALDWYVEQFQRPQFEDEDNAEITTGRVDSIGHGFNDPKAPKFL